MRRITKENFETVNPFYTYINVHQNGHVSILRKIEEDKKESPGLKGWCWFGLNCVPKQESVNITYDEFNKCIMWAAGEELFNIYEFSNFEEVVEKWHIFNSWIPENLWEKQNTPVLSSYK